MDMEKIGRFIAALRKSNGLTQQDVADRLGITDKTVSKWECGNGLPDITAIPAIAELFGVTTDEILRGERIHYDRQPEREQRKTAEQANAYLVHACRNIAFGFCCCYFSAFVLFLASLHSLYGHIVPWVYFLYPVVCGITMLGWGRIALALKGVRQNAAVWKIQGKHTSINNAVRHGCISLFCILYALVFTLWVFMESIGFNGFFQTFAWNQWAYHGIAAVLSAAGLIICAVQMRRE